MSQISKVRVHTWKELPKETVRPGVERAGFRGQDVLMVMNWLDPGMEVNPHSHPCEQLVYVVQGTMRFVVDGEELQAGPGSLIRIPPGAEHYGEPIGDEQVLNLDVWWCTRRRISTNRRPMAMTAMNENPSPHRKLAVEY